MRIPQEQMPGYAPGDQISVQTLSTNGHFGAYSALSETIAPEEYPLAAPVPYRFVDARPHLKENLKFLLQSATLTQPFNYIYVLDSVSADPTRVWFPETEFARPPSPTNYEYSGFHVFSSNLNYSVMQEFRPVQENFLWRNLAYYAGDFGEGYWSNGVGNNFGSTLRWLFDPNYQFACTNCDPLPLSLSVSNYPYLYGISSFPSTTQELTNDLAEVGVWLNGYNFYVPSGLQNVYGLPLNSVLVGDTFGDSLFPLEAGGSSLQLGYLDLLVTFCSFEPAALNTMGYYFVSQTPYFSYNAQSAASRPPLPGSPDFTTATTSPLMVAGFGQPITVSGWAKESINGNNGKYAYLEQYFTNAYTIDGNWQRDH